MTDNPEPVLPDYGGACLDSVIPAVLRRRDEAPPWLPPLVVDADQVVVLVLDGLGWEQLQERAHLAPTLSTMAGGPITTVAPSTTATALTSLTTGVAPALHGIVGYRMVVGGEVLNVLRWTTATGDARSRVLPDSMQPLEPFLGTKPPVVTRAEFADSGFSRAHLAGSELYGWRYPSTLVCQVVGLLTEGHPFVYAYYAGIDAVAHEFGFGFAYDAELAAADRLVADLIDVLPAGVAVVVTSDHGQVDVRDRLLGIAPEVVDLTSLLSGEGRFRWLHARPGLADRLAEGARRHHEHHAWVRSREEIVAERWFGGPLSPEIAGRLGDVALVAFEPIAFRDSADTGSMEMVCRHGSLTSAEMLIPLVAARA